MKRCNGSGCVRSLKGNRRKKYQALITLEYNSETKKQRFKSLGTFENRLLAEKCLYDYFYSDKKKKSHLIKDIYKEFYEYKIDKVSHSTAKNYLNYFNHLSKIHNLSIEDIRLNQLQEVFNSLSCSYQRNCKMFLSNLFNYSIKQGYIEKNIVKFVDIDRYNEKEKKVFSFKEITDITNSNDNIDKIVSVLLYTGLRINELLNLEISDCEIEKKYLKVKHSKTHSGIRMIPIHDNIFRILSDSSKNNIKYMFEFKQKKINYSRICYQFNKRYNLHTIHETRHTFISNCKRCGLDEYVTKLIAGHKIDDITLGTYTHYSINDIQKEFKKFRYLL